MEFYGPDEDKALNKRHAEIIKAGGEIPSLTIEEEAIVTQRIKDIELLFSSDDIQAKYKIEIQFVHDRTARSHFPGSITVFLSGSALGGEGDEPVFPCLNPNCPGFIPPNLISTMMGVAICPVCEFQWPQDKLSESILARLTNTGWAILISRIFIRLNGDADIYLKYSLESIRKSTEKEKIKNRGGELLNVTRHKRRKVIYPMKNIYRDLSSGSTLESRIRSLLEA